MLKYTLRALVALAMVPAAAAGQATGALGLEDVADLAQLGGSEEVKQNLIRKSCVSFPLDDAATARLREAGASAALLETVRTACFTGAELVVESDPAGAEVLIDGQSVGQAPYTARFAGARNVEIVVKANGRTSSSKASLKPGIRTRAAFALALDTVPVPGVRSVAEVARDLDLERRWVPLDGEPSEPQPPAHYGSGFSETLFRVAGALGGGLYCKDAANHCWLEPDINEEGKDSMEPVRIMAGAAAGILAGSLVNTVIGKVVNSARATSYENAVAARADWGRRNEEAKRNWILNHRDLVAQRAAQQNARDEAIRRNAEIRRRNGALQAVRITTEALAKS